jgi:ribonuclease HI
MPSGAEQTDYSACDFDEKVSSDGRDGETIEKASLPGRKPPSRNGLCWCCSRKPEPPPAMSVPAPHFLLYAEAARATPGAGDDTGEWRFVLRLPGGETSLEAADEEPEATPQRLELLAVVRGLEALSQPSRVTLLTGSRYLRRGLDSGISQWRENEWQWERYGRMAPVKNSDLWQRLDRLLTIHELECKPTRLEKADDLAPPRRRVEMAAVQGGGRVVRMDAGHGGAKHQISNHKSQTNSKFKRRNVRKPTPRRHWKFETWNLFGHWSLVIGHLRSLLARWLQTRSRES